MKNQNCKLKDLIRIWMKACFKRAMEQSRHETEQVNSRGKESKLNKRQKRGIYK